MPSRNTRSTIRQTFLLCLVVALSFTSAAIAETISSADENSRGETIVETTATPSWDVVGTTGMVGSVIGDARLSRVTLQSGDRAACTKRIEFGPTAGAIVCRFDLSLTSQDASSTVNQVFRVGSSFSTSTGDESEASTFGSLGLVGTATGTGFMLLDRSTKRASPAFEGNQAITWALNNSGKAVSYDAPNGTVESLPNDRMDVWVGRTRVFDDAAVDNARAAISDLQWSWSAGAGSTMFAHLEARSLDPVAAKATVAEVPSASEVDVHSVELYKPWPNPSSAPIRYAYEIASGLERVDIGVFDIAGRSVRSLVSGTQSRGRYEVVWDGLSNDGVRMRGAVYFLRASVGSSTRVSRVILMK